jgi:NitT/TauT family transport system permease protein
MILAWELGARAVGKDIILPGPGRVLKEALLLYPSPAFLSSLGATFLRGLLAFALSTVAGSIAGLAAGLSPMISAAIAPLLTVIRATPVLSLILLALLWFPADAVPVFTAFLMAFPVMVSSAQTGASAADRGLVEMTRLFRVPAAARFLNLTLPTALPHLLSGARSALGLSWKVVVAGEVLSQPLRALGSGMQASRVLLETPRVFAWAAAAVLLCGLAEWLFGRLVRRVLVHGL